MKKLRLKKTKQKDQSNSAHSRITNETVAEHRERILASGKKFKYPHQYVRHKLVINATIIAVLTVLLIVALGWWQLYVAQNTTNFMYRVTRVIPVPVASVDGELARYSDYLMRYRSQELWLKNQGQLGLSNADGRRQLDYIKRTVLEGVELDTYAAKRAKELNITVSDRDIDQVIDQNRNTSTGRISQEVYDNSTKATLGYGPDEYRHIIRQSLVRQKVAYQVDSTAKQTAEQVQSELKKTTPPNMQAIVEALSTQGRKVEFGASGLVPKNNQDGGLSQAALKLKDGQVSGLVTSTTADGYYYVQMISETDRQVSYQFIKIPLTVFANNFATLKKQQKITEFITLTNVEQIKR